MARAVLLDLGNVLVRFDHGTTLARLTPIAGVPAEDLRPHVFGRLEKEFDLGRLPASAFFRAVERAAAIPRLDDAVWTEAWRDIFTADADALRLLPRLVPGVTPVLVSNTNALHWEGVLRAAPGLDRLLPLRALSFEVGAAKPDPAHFRAALALANTRPEEAVFADDRLEMVEAARTLGIDAFQVNDAESLEMELGARRMLEPAGADPTAHPLFVKGLEEFRRGSFFEAHEEWEALWMWSQGDARLLLQALIQTAAAGVHFERGNRGPGIRLLTLAEAKLDHLPERYARETVVCLRGGIRRAAALLGEGRAPGEAAQALRL